MSLEAVALITQTKKFHGRYNLRDYDLILSVLQILYVFMSCVIPSLCL